MTLVENLLRVVYAGNEQVLEELEKAKEKDLIAEVYHYRIKYSGNDYLISDLTSIKEEPEKLLTYMRDIKASIVSTPLNDYLNITSLTQKKSLPIIVIDSSLSQYKGNIITGDKGIKAILLLNLDQALNYINNLFIKGRL
jgi:hypothetical protein